MEISFMAGMMNPVLVCV
ncbi:Protein of unknown function [Bacillus mycoides]|nr:Protein of unknown function [Bacillus mycoides]